MFFNQDITQSIQVKKNKSNIPSERSNYFMVYKAVKSSQGFPTKFIKKFCKEIFKNLQF